MNYPAASSEVVHFIDIIKAAEAIFAYTDEVQCQEAAANHTWRNPDGRIP